jgi:hypothetical protein
MTSSTRWARGFRRLVTVLSAGLLFAGVSIDFYNFSQMETLRIDVRDGRSVEIHPRYGWRRTATTEDFASIVNTLASGPVAATAKDINHVVVIRGVVHQWWDEADFTRIAAIAVAVLWLLFIAACWITRGFAPPEN